MQGDSAEKYSRTSLWLGGKGMMEGRAKEGSPPGFEEKYHSKDVGEECCYLRT